MSSAETREPAAAEAVSRLCGRDDVVLHRLGGGRNSQVYLAAAPDGRRRVAKVYFRSPDDPRDRLGAERQALTFLAGHGVDCVPRVLGCDDQAGVLLLEHIDGEPVQADGVTTADADALADFAGRLRQLAGSESGAALGFASEACFSQDDLVSAVERRIARLAAAVAEPEDGPALGAFLETRFAPAFERHRRPAPHGATLPRAWWTLSQSDFGLHNAVRRRDGRLAFVDFEYFGWDDPAKLTADALLHPGMPLPVAAWSRLSERLAGTFAAVPGFRERLATVFPLCALNWALIMLNEFDPAHARRRSFAGVDGAAIRRRQLARATEYLTHA